MNAARLMLACAVTLAPSMASAQMATADNPLTDSTKAVYNIVKGNIIKGAEKMAEADYSFQPTKDVRTFGQLVGHIANANAMICGAAVGEKSTLPDAEKLTSKAESIKALQASFDFCDGIFAKMNDKTGVELVEFFRMKQPRVSVLAFNNAHDYEHYGNMVTYMRIKGLVPPSSEGR